ncbi:hypothetical protein ES708_21721 [subsurface metagenome]
MVGLLICLTWTCGNMPRSTREWAKRKLGEAVQSLDWAVYHLGEVGQRYEEQHPEVSDPLLEIILACEAIKTYIDKVNASF